MRQNRLSQRLKSKLDSFGFDALIKGVSTLVEETVETTEPNPVLEPELALESAPVTTAVLPPTDTVVTARDSGMAADQPLTINGRSEVSRPIEVPEPARIAASETYQPAVRATATAVLDQEPPATVVKPESVRSEVSRKQPGPEPLREALYALSCRLSQEAGRMAAALEQRDVEEAGFYLAHVNQILELLHTLDTRGDMARQLGVDNAPPVGRAWPLTAWTVVEFAESPFSALLPADAGESFVREVIYAAWGISFNGN